MRVLISIQGLGWLRNNLAMPEEIQNKYLPMFKTTRTKDPKWWHSLSYYNSNKKFTKRPKPIP